MNGLIGKKVGMTRAYDDQGQQVSVTVIEAGPCVVVQRKSKAKEGYDAVQLGFGDQKEGRMPKAAVARFKKVNSVPKVTLKEFSPDEGENVSEGGQVNVTIFDGVSHVDVMGITKGRGWAGVVRRHRMRGGPLTHGGHSKRRIGAIGQNSFPARVVKGKRMPGHMGHVRVTQENLKVVEVRGEENLLLVRGAVPGPNGAIVFVRKALKKGGSKKS